MGEIIECLANKCKHWKNYKCINKEPIKLNGNAECKNYKEKVRENGTR